MYPISTSERARISAGRRHEGLDALIREHAPELIVASGDLTHRNRRDQHEEAAAFLRRLGPPVLAVPGNHDMPALPPRRFSNTFGAFSTQWGKAESIFHSDALTVVGLASARPWLYQEGLLTKAQLEWARLAFEQRPANARVLVIHHHLASAPWRTAKRPLLRRSSLITALADLGVELVLAGHIHQSSTAVAGEVLCRASKKRCRLDQRGARPPPAGPGRRGARLPALEDHARSACLAHVGWVDSELRELSRRTFPR